MTDIPWSEKVVAFQINPDAASRGDIARMAEELIITRNALNVHKEELANMYNIIKNLNEKFEDQI